MARRAFANQLPWFGLLILLCGCSASQTGDSWPMRHATPENTNFVYSKVTNFGNWSLVLPNSYGSGMYATLEPPILTSTDAAYVQYSLFTDSGQFYNLEYRASLSGDMLPGSNQLVNYGTDGPLASHSGLLFFSGFCNESQTLLQVFDATGQLKWSKCVAAPCSPAMTTTDSLLVACGGTLTSYSLASGLVLDSVSGTPALSVLSAKSYIGVEKADSGGVGALSLSLDWIWRNSSISFQEFAVDSQELTVYGTANLYGLVGENLTVARLDGERGTLLWNISLPLQQDKFIVSNLVAVAGHGVLVKCGDLGSGHNGPMYFVSLNGHIMWSTDAMSIVGDRPVVLGNNEILLCQNDETGGQYQVKRYSLTGSLVASVPLMGGNEIQGIGPISAFGNQNEFAILFLSLTSGSNQTYQLNSVHMHV